MKYEAKIVDMAHNMVKFEFEADDNTLASDHIAHCCSDREMMGHTFKDAGYTGYDGVRKASFRRHYAKKWITSVAV